MMNNDLISRNALVEKLLLFENVEPTQRGISTAIAAVLDQPYVDAEPVRHGRWIHCNGKSNIWYCSACGEKIIYNPIKKHTSLKSCLYMQ